MLVKKVLNHLENSNIHAVACSDKLVSAETIVDKFFVNTESFSVSRNTLSKTETVFFDDLNSALEHVVNVLGNW